MPDLNLPGALLGYRKNGQPIRLQAGGDPTNDPEGTDPAEPQGKTFTEEELNRLLQRERDKLHGRLDKATSQQDAMKKELEELRQAEQARAQAEEQARKDAEEAARKAAEAEMSAKELIDRRTAEFQAQQKALEDNWANQVSTLQQQMAEREAVFQREREFQELATYAANQVNAHQEEIAPELVKYIGRNCNSKEEIDASVREAIEATSAILAGIQNAQQVARSQMPGVSTGGFTPTGPIDNPGGPRQYTPEDIANMSMDEYAKNRGAFGVAGNSGRGLFG